MFEDDVPFYQRLPFDFMLSTAIFIVFAEIILFGFAILEMQGRIEFVRQLVMENVSNFNSLNPSAILSDQDTKKILRHYIQSRLLMVLVLTTVVLSGLYFVLNRMIISPLRIILKKNRKTAEEDKLALIESDEIPNNEIGSIMRSRNKMLNTINTLYNEQALDTLREAVDAKDEYTEGHSRRVGEIASMLGEHLELPASDCEKLKHSGLLHDVGKIAVEDRILTKEGALTDSEFDEIMTHPARGEKIIKFSRFSDSVLEGVRHHHEQFDGSGYPDGLSGLDIPLFGRILAVADAVDAMLSNRHYRDALSWAETRQELEENSGTQFDPDIAEAGINLLQPDNRDNLPEFN